jgi:hypothetical protein
MRDQLTGAGFCLDLPDLFRLLPGETFHPRS